MKKTLTTLLIALGLLTSCIIQAQVPTGTSAPAFSATDSNGKKHQLKDFQGEWVVLEWFNPECPFVKKHYNSENMQKLQKKYTDAGVIWLTVASSAVGKQGHLTQETANPVLQNYKSKATTLLLDESGAIGRLYQAKTTPHVFLIDPNGTLVYQGAIDDKPSTDVEDIPGAKNYLAEALDASMAKKKVPTGVTEPYGCSVKY